MYCTLFLWYPFPFCNLSIDFFTFTVDAPHLGNADESKSWEKGDNKKLLLKLCEENGRGSQRSEQNDWTRKGRSRRGEIYDKC